MTEELDLSELYEYSEKYWEDLARQARKDYDGEAWPSMGWNKWCDTYRDVIIYSVIRVGASKDGPK